MSILAMSLPNLEIRTLILHLLDSRLSVSSVEVTRLLGLREQIEPYVNAELCMLRNIGYVKEEEVKRWKLTDTGRKELRFIQEAMEQHQQQQNEVITTDPITSSSTATIPVQEQQEVNAVPTESSSRRRA
jgi:hypothetical protein